MYLYIFWSRTVAWHTDLMKTLVAGWICLTSTSLRLLRSFPLFWICIILVGPKCIVLILRGQKLKILYKPRYVYVCLFYRHWCFIVTALLTYLRWVNTSLLFVILTLGVTCLWSTTLHHNVWQAYMYWLYLMLTDCWYSWRHFENPERDWCRGSWWWSKLDSQWFSCELLVISYLLCTPLVSPFLLGWYLTMPNDYQDFFKKNWTTLVFFMHIWRKASLWVFVCGRFKPKHNPKHIIGMLRQIIVIGAHAPPNHLQLLKRNRGTIFVKLKNPMPQVVGSKSKLIGKITPNLLQKYRYF
jgi:hypothetical protein